MKYNDSNLTVSKKGVGFEAFKKCFGPDDRGYGYIRIIGGDEVSKRTKFVFVTWCGESVPAMKKVIINIEYKILKNYNLPFILF